MRAVPTAAPSLVDVTPYYGHLRCFRDLCPLAIMTNPFTYAPSYTPRGEMQNTWLSIALEGIERLFLSETRREPWKDVSVIGTGNGLDVVGISRIVGPEKIVASDIHPKALEAARWNTARYADGGCEVTLLESDLFGAYPAGRRFDLIYENLPNIPDGSELFAGIRSASCYTPRATRVPSVHDRHLLTLHHEFLCQARGRLREDGRVVCVIGGRIPVRWIHRMFRDAGFRSRVAGFGLKIQSEADVVLPGYAAAERENGSHFTYYHPVERCIEIARGLPPPSDVADWEDYAQRLTGMLRPCRISASEAARLHGAGEPVCHTVYALAGTLNANGGANG
jgi:hypothetical protein